MQFAADGSNGRLFATGLRNAVGFDWAPWNAQMYATDNGRDWLGDDFPPCELNRVVAGGFYGWPYINGFGQLDPDMGKGKQALLASAISPVMGFGAHQAPLAIHFIRDGAGFPERSALVALHGSWNRRTPAGYKVELLVWQADGSVQSQDFLTGFELGGDIIGRPVDVVQGPRGDIYVSDDYAGTIYRVSYGLSGG
jgi:glucose/arabinose dehydrogenase